MPKEAIAYLVGLSQRPWPIYHGNKLTFGRDPSNTHVLNDGKVSRKHAVLEVTGLGLITLQDLGSSNGTLLNDKRIDPGLPIPLKSGDTFALGAVIITLLADKSSRVATSVAKEQSRLGSGVTPVSKRHEDIPGASSDAPTREHPPVGVVAGMRTTQYRNMTDAVAARLNQPCPPEGNLEEFWFAQVLQALHRDEMTGELNLEREGEDAVVSFKDGQIVFAMKGEALGIDVIALLAGWRKGTYKFKRMPQIQRPTNIILPTKSIILQCCQFGET